jgi:hypothetical protein
MSRRPHPGQALAFPVKLSVDRDRRPAARRSSSATSRRPAIHWPTNCATDPLRAACPAPSARLDVAYQIALLPPYFVNVGQRLVKAPKVPALDSDLVAQVAGLTTWEGPVTAGRDGSLLETWVIDDLIASDRLSGPGVASPLLAHGARRPVPRWIWSWSGPPGS